MREVRLETVAGGEEDGDKRTNSINRKTCS